MVNLVRAPLYCISSCFSSESSQGLRGGFSAGRERGGKTITITSLAKDSVNLVENIESEGVMTVASPEGTDVPLPVLIGRPVVLAVHGHQHLLHWVGHQHGGLTPPVE